MTTGTEVITGHAILQMEWADKRSPFSMGLDEMLIELEKLSTISRLSEAIARGVKPDQSSWDRIITLDVDCRRLRYESPVVVDLAFGPAVAASVPALSYLIYMVKRFWGLDLELKAHRQEMRLRFLEAKEQADLAESRLAAYGLAVPEDVPDEINEDLGWGRGATQVRKLSKNPLQGKRATLSLDDD